MLKGFGRRPQHCKTIGAGPAFESLVRRKPRGGGGAVWLGGTYGDLKVADGSDVPLRGPEAPSVIGGSEDGELFRLQAYEGVA